MNRKCNRYISFVFLFCLFPLQNMAQTVIEPDAENTNWYIGIQGGVPFGVSTFSSFGADKTRAGYDIGLYAGYRFNPVLSLEAQTAWGEIGQSAQDCCASYWLGNDFNRYEVPVAGINGWSYENLKTDIATQRYGLQLNVNLLGFFARTKESRWSLDISPSLAAIGTKSSIQTITDGNDIRKKQTNWHLGAGGNLQAGYRITHNLNIGVYTGITYLTGDPMDAMPDYLHKNNFIWESGLRLGWTFGRKKTTSKPVTTVFTPKEQVEEAARPSSEPVKREQQENIETAPVGEVQTEVTATEEAADTIILFPSVHFPFNSTVISEAEEKNAQHILEVLETHPDIHVTITGWCDTRGSQNVNARISLQRAEALKAWLVKRGIHSARIRTVGRGSDFKAVNPEAARRADTQEQEKEDNRL